MVILKQDILWFQVLVHDTLRVQVAECINNLPGYSCNLLSLQRSLCLKILLEVAALAMLNQNVQLLLFCLVSLGVASKEIVVFDDAWMI